MTSFTIPYPPTKKGKSAFCRRFGLNAYYAGKHWSVRKRDADELHLLCQMSMKKAGITKNAMYAHPVTVRFLWNDGLDIDNHAAIGKCFVDAMKGILIADDNRRCVTSVSHAFWDGDCIKVQVEAERSCWNGCDAAHKAQGAKKTKAECSLTSCDKNGAERIAERDAKKRKIDGKGGK